MTVRAVIENVPFVLFRNPAAGVLTLRLLFILKFGCSEISATLGNGKDWTWDDLLPHFKASETIIAPESQSWAKEHGATFDPSFHGSSGPLKRGFVPWLGESHVPFFKALNNLGVPTNPDSVRVYIAETTTQSLIRAVLLVQWR